MDLHVVLNKVNNLKKKEMFFGENVKKFKGKLLILGPYKISGA